MIVTNISLFCWKSIYVTVFFLFVVKNTDFARSLWENFSSVIGRYYSCVSVNLSKMPTFLLYSLCFHVCFFYFCLKI